MHKERRQQSAKTAEYENVLISDMTLRAATLPGISMSRTQMEHMADELIALNVDVVRLGLVPDNRRTISLLAHVAGRFESQQVCVDAGIHPGALDTARQVLVKARQARINLHVDASQVDADDDAALNQQIEQLQTAIAAAQALDAHVEVSAQHALYVERAVLVKLFAAAIAAGAGTVSMIDSSGFAAPVEMGALTQYLVAHVPQLEQAVLGVQCSNDLGMATANSMAAITQGARQVVCAVGGVGRRAGTAALEEIVMALALRCDLYQLRCHVEPTRLYPAARTLAQIVGQPVPRAKPIVGVDVFIRDREQQAQHSRVTANLPFKPLDPQDVGMPIGQLVLNKDSDQRLLAQRLQELGYTIDAAELDALYTRFQELAERKRDIHDGDLEALVQGHDPAQTGPWHIVHLHTVSNLGRHASASVGLAHADGRKASETATGDGPVDAVLRAFERAFDRPLKLVDFRIHAISQGGDAQGMVTLDVEYDGRLWHGQGVSTDIVGASAHAALEVINSIARREQCNNVQETSA